MAEAAQWAEDHLIARNSVVLECQVWQEALGRARGEWFGMILFALYTGLRLGDVSRLTKLSFMLTIEALDSIADLPRSKSSWKCYPATLQSSRNPLIDQQC